MSDFNYPIQVDDSTYNYTVQDINYNQVFNEVFNNSDIKDILKKLRIQLKLGIESDLTETAYFYVVLLDYFDALFEYYSKATDTEKSTFYTDYIKCVENIAVCKSNPKLMRALNDLVKVIPPTECGLSYLTDNSCYYRSGKYLYILNNKNRNNFTEQFCFSYLRSTFDVNYFEKSTDDLDASNHDYSYNFVNNSLLNIGIGTHRFKLNRKTNRRIYFLVDDVDNTFDFKYATIELVTYIGDVIDGLDPNNVSAPNIYVTGGTGQLILFTLDIMYDNNTDITTYSVASTTEISDDLIPLYV